MALGFVEIEGNAVVTHRDSYLLKSLTVVSVRRPLLAPAMLLSSGLCAFGLSFVDLLYLNEMVTIGIMSFAMLIVGWQAGQLKLLSRDLRQSELSGVIWGRYANLNATRRDIVIQLGRLDRLGQVDQIGGDA